MKISIAEIRRRLKPGTPYIAEFIGAVNTRLCDPGMERTKRIVVTNTTTEMKSRFLDGPKEGQDIYLRWVGVSADSRDGYIYLSQSDGKTAGEFLRILELPGGDQ